jgi:RNA polymerase sigma-70 factor, ECF subfamily
MKHKSTAITARASHDEAMARYAGGDDAAFTEVYLEVAPRLGRFLGRRLHDRNKVPDFVQETLLRVHRSKSSFVPGSAVMPWVLTIARRLLIDDRRRAGREDQLDPDELDRLSRHLPGAPPTGEEIVALEQTVTRLDQAWAKVPEPQRAALRLVKGEGLSLAEAAVRLGTTPTGVKLRTHRASRALRAGLAAECAAA